MASSSSCVPSYGFVPSRPCQFTEKNLGRRAFSLQLSQRLSSTDKKYLIRNSADTTNQLLTQITQQLSASAAGSESPLFLSPYDSSMSPRPCYTSTSSGSSALSLSLSLSVACALAATLVQQWARNYLLTTQLPSSPQRRMRVRTYLFQGVQRFRLGSVANAVPVLLRIRLPLFCRSCPVSLPGQQFPGICCVIAYAEAYLVLTLLPLFRRDCPYLTPMSGPLLAHFQNIAVRCHYPFQTRMQDPYAELDSKTHELEGLSGQMQRALCWGVTV